MSKTAHYAAAFNVLGICYLFPPDDDSNRAAMRLFTLPGFAQQWPCEVDNTLCSQLSRTAGEGTEVLKSAWQSLFAGPERYRLRPGAQCIWMRRDYCRGIRPLH